MLTVLVLDLARCKRFVAPTKHELSNANTCFFGACRHLFLFSIGGMVACLFYSALATARVYLM